MLSKPRAGIWPVIVFILWTLFVWLNRISNALRNSALSTGSKSFSVALSLSVVALAAAAAVVVVRGWSRPWTRAEALVLKVAAGWTGLLWLFLVPKILIDGRPAGFTGNLAGFKAVHSVLGLVSVALAVWVWRVATSPVDQESLDPAMQQ
ncbi:MAG TPA: hypothetical protein VIJ47_03690 [Acidimicrobiales bacterium]